MMRVLAVTLGRSSRPCHNDHDDHQHHTPTRPTCKNDTRSLICEQYSTKPEDPGPGILRRGVVKSASLKYCQDLPCRSQENRSRESLITAEHNEAKSATVTRIPRETMSVHRCKLVRNSSISKWRAKFRRTPLTSETGTETDTEQLLDEVEENVKPNRKLERRVGRDANLVKETPRGRIPDLSSKGCSSSGNKYISCSNLTTKRNEMSVSSSCSKKRSTITVEAGARTSRPQKDETAEAWCSVPPPRCLTPHRVHQRGELISWVGLTRQRDGDSNHYIPKGSGHTVSVYTSPHRVCGSPASLPCQRSRPSAVGRLMVAKEGQMGSWPRQSRINGVRVIGSGHINPPQPCLRAVCAPGLTRDLGGSNTPAGSYSHFGTFPRRRPSQKDACGTSEAAQLEQRLRSLGCELVTLRSRLPPALHHSRPTTPPTPITNTTTTTTSANSSFHATNNNNPTPNANTTAATTTATPSTTSSTTAANNNKNAQTHNGAPLLLPSFVGNGTTSSGGSDNRIAPNNSALADGLNSSQSFLADGSCVKGGMTGGVQEVEDLIHLAGPLTEDAVLKTLQARFCSSHYFTNVGPILLSVNPYHEVGNALTLTSTRAAVQSPHLLRVVHEAVRQQSETGYPQAIILSGASGSGKTYTSMLLLRQLFDVAGGGPETDAFKHLAAAFTVLRSLGSAKTRSNSESSRIGHFIEVQVTDGALYRTKIHCYFLDQTRVVRALPDEKNYHIFYQMLAGLTQEERAKLHLEGHSVRTLRYLSEGDVRQDETEDARRFESWKACLGVLGIPFLDVVRVLAAVLLLGNVTFIEGQGLEVDIQGGSHELKSVAALLGVSSAALYRGLTTRTHNVRGQLVKSMCDANMSNMTRDALAKALYCRTVATIVRRANSLKRLGSTSGTLSSDSNESVHHQAEVASQHASTVGTAGSKASKSMSVLNNAVKHATDGFIGILDMFGFEDPKPSHLEHLCINLCAETMQHFYNTHIFKSSIESCREEGITCEVEVDYVDNVPCIDLISSLRTGLLSMLDVEGSVRGTPESYIQKVKVQHKGNARLFEPKANHVRSFGIHHFASRVIYDASDFLDTNRDIISDDLVCVFHKHSCNFGFATHLFGSELKALFSQDPVPRGVSFRISPTSHTDLQNGDEPVSTLTQDFHTRLDNLLRTLVHAKPHFIRCLRSNCSEKPALFDRATVIKQIRALQVLETVNLMAGGYPHRMRFKTFNMRYRLLVPFKKLRRVEDKTVDDCKLILEYFVRSLEDVNKSSTVAIQWALGKRHIFLSEGARQQLEMLRIEMRHRAATLLQSVWRGWHFRRRWPTLKRNLELRARSRTVRPRPQPIAGTPPPDVMDRCDQKTIQQTCSLFGLDLERPPPVPPSRSYTITGNHKMGYPQTRVMKRNFPEEGGSETVLLKGESVVVVGASPRRGHLLVDYQGHSFHVPFQYMELKPSAQPGVNI